MSRLPSKQAKFIREYLIDLNGTQAAIRAGYSPKGAEVSASRLLRNAKVAEELGKRQAELSKRVGVTQERVIRELCRLAFVDMNKFTRWGSKGVELVESSALDEDDSVCVAEVSETVTKDGGTKRFKLHDKVAALTQLAKHLGLTPESIRAVREGQQPGQYEDVPTQEQIKAEAENLMDRSAQDLVAELRRGVSPAPSNGNGHVQPHDSK